MAFGKPPQSPREEYGGQVESQIKMARKALNYRGRFSPPEPGDAGTTAQDAERWENVRRGSGAGK